MGLSDAYVPISQSDGCAVLQHALRNGIRHFDTADFYGRGENELLLARALGSVREGVFVATKCGLIASDRGKAINGRPEYIRRACHASLRRLRTDYLDLLYLHRVDPGIPVEESIGAMGALVTEGKVRWLGLSKITTKTLRRAQAVHPIAAVQMQYSLLARDVEESLTAHCSADGIVLVAYAPLCKGLLAGRRVPDCAYRRNDTRYSNPAAIAVVDVLQRHADSIGCHPGQLALAWVLSRGRYVVPVTGMRTRTHVDAAVGTLTLSVPSAVFQDLDHASATFHRVAAGQTSSI